MTPAAAAAALPGSPFPLGATPEATRLWGSQSRFDYAACEYSLINPLRIDRR